MPPAPVAPVDVLGELTRDLKPEPQRPAKWKAPLPAVQVVADQAIAGLRHQEVQAERCFRSLSYFVRASWPSQFPGTPLLWNWHLEEICKHVQGILQEWEKRQDDPGDPETGEGGYQMLLQNLVVNCPPRSLKSTIVSICATAWMWLRRPTWKAIFVSSNPKVAIRDARGCHALLTSPWYRVVRDLICGGHRLRPWEIDADKDADGNFSTTLGGYRLAMGMLAVVVGLGGDAIFVDDPNDTRKVHSAATRSTVNDTWDLSLRNRVNSYTDSIRVMIMQRCHEDDLTGHWRKTMPPDRTVYLEMPLEYNADMAARAASASPFGYLDPRTVDGQCIHPARFPEWVIAAERAGLGPYGFSGQLNQAPAPEDGANFQRNWWNWCHVGSSESHHHALVGTILHRQWKYSVTPLAADMSKRPRGACDRPSVPVPFLDRLLISVDATFGSTSDTASRVGLMLIGMKGPDRFVLDDRTMVRNFNETLDAIRKMKDDYPTVRIVLVERKANGQAVIDVLSREIGGMTPIDDNDNWQVRANAMMPGVASGNWYILEGAPWAEEFVGEFGLFPSGSHDDRIDSCSQADIKYGAGGYSLPDW